MKKFERKDLDWPEEFQDQSLKQMRHIINALTDKFGEDAILKFEHCWDHMDFWVEVERPETPEEKDARIAKEKKKLEADRKKFEALKTKYGW